jgi:hypothetical protein
MDKERMAGGGRGYLTEARGKNNVRQDGVLAETRNGCITRAFGELRLARLLCVCYKFLAVFRLTTSAFHQFSCARN